MPDQDMICSELTELTLRVLKLSDWTERDLVQGNPLQASHRCRQSQGAAARTMTNIPCLTRQFGQSVAKSKAPDKTRQQQFDARAERAQRETRGGRLRPETLGGAGYAASRGNREIPSSSAAECQQTRIVGGPGGRGFDNPTEFSILDFLT